MNSLIVKLCVLLLLLGGSQTISAQAFNVDPALAFAVKTSSDQETSALNGISKEQSTINKLQTAANIQLKKIEEIQKKAYNYLTNITAGVQNAYDIKKSYELTKEIAALCKELKNAVIENPQGLITTAVATKYISSVTKEVTETYSYIASISLNKKTLLNSAERLEITWRVRTQLTNIYQRLYNLIYKIRALKLSDLPALIAPEAYYGLMSQKSIAESVIREYYHR